jgi:Regulator of chromosome condensation (RCC1) repeat
MQQQVQLNSHHCYSADTSSSLPLLKLLAAEQSAVFSTDDRVVTAVLPHLQVTCYPTAVRVPASAGAVVHAACGRRHSALLTGATNSSTTTASGATSNTGGIVLTFGCGLRGQLGNGCTTDTLTVPTVVRSLEGVGALQPGSSQGGITCKCCLYMCLRCSPVVV